MPLKVVRYVILALSTGAMASGTLIIGGVFEVQTVPEQFRVILGVVVFLYGLYRFVVEYVRKREG